MGVRPATFPVVFGGALALLTLAFYNRHRFVTKPEEQLERWGQSQQQAQNFQRKLKEGIEEKKSEK
jgi:hypothetical protein